MALTIHTIISITLLCNYFTTIISLYLYSYSDIHI